MRVDEALAQEARVTLAEARAACQEHGVNERIDLDNLEGGLTLETLTHIQTKVAAARTKLMHKKARR